MPLVPKPPLACSLRFSIHEYFSTGVATLRNQALTGSAKLLSDAELEDSAGDKPPTKSAHLQSLESREENWTGDEPIEHAVLRMLVDKYKPLRTGTIQTAEERLKQNPPSVVGADTVERLARLVENVRDPAGEASSKPSSSPASGSWAMQELIPSTEGHRPWHTTFKVPSHVTPSIRMAILPSSRPSQSKSEPARPDDERLKRIERQQKNRAEQAGRLANARESTLDYRLGIRAAQSHLQAGSRPNPVGVKGWASLVEDRIEKARVRGLFNNVKGRGKPIIHNAAEHNPFIGREEFLMNRIVQKNGAAPPWVEIQQEMEAEITSFREILRQAWIRHALRSLTVALQAYPGSHQPSLAEVSALRDTAWEQKEAAYHDAALSEINALVRKYNTVAPYAVRRPLYTRVQELERMYGDAAGEIMTGLEERRNKLSGNNPNHGGPSSGDENEGKVGVGSSGDDTNVVGLSDVFRRWIGKVIQLVRWK